MLPEQLTDRECLALTLIGEARGEPIESIVGVGSVVRNRVHGKDLSDFLTYKQVCLKPEQFSCWNENDPNRPFLLELGDKLLNGQTLTDPYLRQCILVANGIIDYDLIDNTKGADYYLATNLIRTNQIPKWALKRKSEIVHGNHTFFSI